MAAARPKIDWRSLHDETERINTFLDYFPIRTFAHMTLAELGFAYIKELKAIACVFCRKCADPTIDINSCREKIEKFHAQLSPYCPMVTGARSRNKPLVLRQEYLDRLFQTPRHPAIDIQIADIPWHRLNQERHRLRTFCNHPTITPQASYRFALSGFAYISSQNSVTCAFCGESLDNNKLAQMIEEDDVAKAHKEISPNCPMVTGKRCLNLPVIPHFNPRYEEYTVGSTIPINPNDPVSLPIRPREESRFDLGIITEERVGIDWDRPKYHFSRGTRELSFRVLNINAQPLIDQGFFYQQENHQNNDPENPALCVCYWCNFAFNPVDWTDDLPEVPVVHALYEPHCRAMKAYTPQSFIDVLHEMQDNLDPTYLDDIVELADVFNELRSRNIHAELGLQTHPVYPDNLDTNPAVTTAVENFGWSQEDAVRGAIRLLEEDKPINADEINTKLENLVIDGVKPVRVNPGAFVGVKAGCSQNPEEDERRAAELEASMKKLKDKIEEIRDDQLCMCCLSKQKDTMLIPCSHTAMCKECSLSMTKCLLCRETICGRVQIRRV